MAEEKPNGKKLSILVIEDDESARAGIINVLRR